MVPWLIKTQKSKFQAEGRSGRCHASSTKGLRGGGQVDDFKAEFLQSSISSLSSFCGSQRGSSRERGTWCHGLCVGAASVGCVVLSAGCHWVPGLWPGCCYFCCSGCCRKKTDALYEAHPNGKGALNPCWGCGDGVFLGEFL